MKRLIALSMALTLVGCATEPRSYSTGISKAPWVLTLQPDGSYTYEHLFTDEPVELGRWWQVDDSIVMLLPNAADKNQYFAWVKDKPNPFGTNLWLYDDLRSALTDENAWFRNAESSAIRPQESKGSGD